MSIQDRTCIVARDFRAPASLLFSCYSSPEQLKEWFGPGTYPLAECEMEFRVGGRIEMAMRGPDGELTPRFGGEYLAIEPDHRIVYSNQFLDEQEREAPMIVTITFEERGELTRLTVHTLFSSEDQARRHMEMGYAGGVTQGLVQLDERLVARHAEERA